MIAVALKGLFAHKLRLAMTALSIAIGVAFVAGTLILTDTLDASFGRAAADRYAGVDVVVRSQAAFGGDGGDGGVQDARAPVPQALLAAVESVPGVADAEGAVSGFAMMVDAAGTPIGTGAIATTGLSTHTNPALASAVSYAGGRAPAGPGEVAVDAATAAKHDVAVGDRIRILFTGPPGEFTVVGVARFGGIDSLGGGTAALFDTATAQQVLGRAGAYDSIDVQAADGVGAAALAERIAASLPDGVEAATGSAVADEGAQRVKEGMKYFNIFMMVFAAIAVFVGSFIIWNTFTITVAQRGRELALLRALGASRRQVGRSVLVEALAVGVVSALGGLAAGVGLAEVLTLLLTAVGLEVPDGGTVFTVRTVVVSMLVGTVVTLVASVAPARAATRVAPVEALRESTPGAYRFSRRRGATGVAVTAAGAAALAAGLFGGAGIALVGVGVLVVFLGVTVLLPLASRPAAAIVGLGLRRLGGVAGHLAQDNAARNPKRTASTAAALMIGLGLVAAVSVLAASLKASVNADLDRAARADLIVTQAGGQGPGISPAAADTIAAVPGVAAVSEFAAGPAEVDGEAAFVASVDPATVEDALDFGMASGGVAGLAGGSGVLVYDETARAKGWAVGSEVAVVWPQTGAHPLRVVGTYTDKGPVGSEYLVSLATYDANATDRLDQVIAVMTEPGAAPAAVQDAVAAALRDYPNAQALTAEEYKESVAAQVDEFLVFIVAMLLLAVVIALLGIVNTLALSVFERRRELGLLRAVGMSRRQVRSMVRWESVIIATLGAVTGALVGLGFGVALTRAMAEQGVGTLAIPAGQIVVAVAVAALAGVLAAVGPARRASRVDILRAVVTE